MQYTSWTVSFICSIHILFHSHSTENATNLDAYISYAVLAGCRMGKPPVYTVAVSCCFWKRCWLLLVHLPLANFQFFHYCSSNINLEWKSWQSLYLYSRQKIGPNILTIYLNCKLDRNKDGATTIKFTDVYFSQIVVSDYFVFNRAIFMNLRAKSMAITKG